MTASSGIPVQLLAALLAALAVIPVGIFLVWQGELSVVLALVNVLLIAASLYYLFSPADSPHEPTTG